MCFDDVIEVDFGSVGVYCYCGIFVFCFGCM